MQELDLLAALRRWWWAVLLGTVLAALGGYAVAGQLTERYDARVDLLVGPVNSDISLDASGGLARTYAQLAISRPVLEQTLRAAKVKRSPVEFAKSVSTTSNSITRILSLTVSDPNPRIAARLANELATRVRVLANHLPPASDTGIGRFASEPEVDSLAPNTRAEVLAAAKRVFGASTAGKVKVVDAAEPPSKPSSPPVRFITVAGGVAGMVLAGLLSLLAEGRARRRIDEQGLLQMDAAYLGTVEAVRSVRNAEVAVESQPGAPAAESYRLVAARLEARLAGEPLRSMLVVDRESGAAAAVVAANVAFLLAQGNRSVVLVDLNSVTPGVTTLLGQEGQPGFGELTRDPSGVDRVTELSVSYGERLRLLPRGAPGDRFQSTERIGRLLQQLEDSADLVVLAGPPLDRVSAGLLWAGVSDGSILVADAHASPEDTARVLGELRRSGGKLLGTVLARMPGSVGAMVRRPRESRAS